MFLIRGLHFFSLSLAFAAGAAALGSGILPELAKALPEEDATAIESHAVQIEAELRSVYASMPHNEQGRMSRPVVRYVLHRLFMQRGWSVRGLEPDGQGWSVGSPEEVLREGMPKQVVELFAARMGGEGLALSDVALLAAAFKAVVRGEVRERLEAAYRGLHVERGAALGGEEASGVLETYVAIHVTGKNVSGMREVEIRDLKYRARRQYHNFPQVMKLAHDVRHSLLGEGAASFADMVRIAEEFGELFGPAEDGSECRPRKQELMGLERGASGRVRLSEFYKAALHDGKWHFGESTAYLRELGALDESDPGDRQVIIPNYLHGRSNCVDNSRHYSACCLNECDALLGRLEAAVGSPSATPVEIAPLVAAMASDTVPGNRTLPAQLLRRLAEVAESNGGRVPLHGRLFAQWLHHAYPRECPFPHLSGTTSPARVEEWTALEGRRAAATREEMAQCVGAPGSDSRDEDEEGECAPWMAQEEILAPHWHAPASPARREPPRQEGAPRQEAVRPPQGAARREGAQRTPASAAWWILSAVLLVAALASGAVHIPAPKHAGGAQEKMGDLAFANAV